MTYSKLKYLVTAVILSAAVFTASSCMIKSAKKSEPVTVYLWNMDLMEEYAPYIQSKLPDIDIEFTVGNNDLDFYKFLGRNGELPDIITNRRFSLHEAAELQPQLLDLSETSQAGAVYLSYLSNYTYSDGTVNWLPLCGEIDGFIANRRLFEKYDIPLPTDSKSFFYACKEFEKHGIRGFVSDFGSDRTCMNILQGLSIFELTSKDGQSWRSRYENLDIPDNGLDEVIWPRVFERMEQFINNVGVRAEDIELSFDDVYNMYVNGEAAIIRGTGSVITDTRADGIDSVMLPYCDDDGNGWLLTYPSFQVALNKELADDEQRMEQALRILDVMLSEEGQNFLAKNKDVIPYSENISPEATNSLPCIKPYIDSNHLYIRLSSNDFFAGSSDAVQKMITGEYTAKQAYSALDARLDESKCCGKVVTEFSCGYSDMISKDGRREASSVMANTLRKYYGADLLIAPSYSFTGHIINTGYSKKMLRYMVTSDTLCAYRRDMTGTDVTALLKASVEGAKGTRYKPFNDGSLPVVSGGKITVKGSDGQGYALVNAKINGKNIDENATYSVVYLDYPSYFDKLASALYPRYESDAFTKYDKGVREVWVEYILGGNDLAAPEKYISIK